MLVSCFKQPTVIIGNSRVLPVPFTSVARLTRTHCRIEGDEVGGEGAGRLAAYVSYGGLLMRLQVSSTERKRSV